MESWRAAWRKGFAPLLPGEGLERLRDRLMANDLRLLRGATTSPPPLACVQDWPVEACCPIGTCFWDDGSTVASINEEFAQACYKADQELGEPAASRYLLNAWDEGDISHSDLLGEVERELNLRRE